MKNILTIAFVLLSMLWPGLSVAWEKDGLRLRGRMIARYQLKDEDRSVGRWTDTLSLNRARIDARWQASEKIRLTLEFDMTQDFEMRDVFVRYTFLPEFKLTVGHFKKPFSRLRLTSRWQLPVPRRGLLDDEVIGDGPFGGYGNRDAGLMLSGRIGDKVRLRYFLGVFDGMRLVESFFRDPATPDEPNASHRDYVGRLQVRLLKGLVLAVNANHKQARIALTPGQELNRSFNLFGGDIRYRYQDFCIQLEGAWGDNPHAMRGHKLLGGHAIVSYRWKINDTYSLTPAMMTEFLDPDDEVADGWAIRLAGALNLDIGAHTRVVLSAESGLEEYSWAVPDYISPEELILETVKPREVPTRIFLQLNLSL